MTTQKDFKRLVRSRMRKTGEAYTAARAQILNHKKPAAARVADVRPADYAIVAGMSDAALKAKTGCTWERWVKSLDHLGAQKMSHAEIAELAANKYKAGPWWAQMVAVGYERIRGLRTRGQQRDGSFQATKSRTFNVSVEVLFDAWSDAGTRKKWLNGTAIKVRTATRPKSMRIDWPGAGIVAVGFFPKGKGKSSVAVEQVKLATREDVARVKEEWAARFDSLRDVLREGGS